MQPRTSHRHSWTAFCAVWLAQGLGVGRIPVAPGTFGSIWGILWAAFLLGWSHTGILIAGTAAGVLLAVPCCGAAERALGKRDPGSVVLDEIVAVPLVFLGCHFLIPGSAQSSFSVILLLAGFALFRLFDIWKPWPVNVSQRLPGGWGVVMDDVLAAGYAAVALLPVGWLLAAGSR